MADVYFCVRVDLDLLPWEDGDGAAEPVAFARLLALARGAGLRLHVFASPRALRAFPAYAEAALGDGHDLDPLGGSSFGGALERHAPMGFALRAGQTPPPAAEGARFVSGSPAFPADLPAFDGTRAGIDRLRAEVRARAARGRSATLALPAGRLARTDPRLGGVREVVSLALAAGLPLRTLREVTAGVD